MTPSQMRGLLAAISAALVLAACSSAPRVAVETSPQPDTGAPAGPASGVMDPIAKAKADSARYPYTAADIHFMSGMIGHHSQAILIAGWAPTHGASAQLRILAERIINAQQDEISIMELWLRDRRQPVPKASATGMKMMMDGMEHEMVMPGMLTSDQLKLLDQATGKEFDRLFLGFMIQHHRGAVTMVTDLFATYGAGQDETVFKFASDVNVDQSTEIARMQRMLLALEIEKRAP